MSRAVLFPADLLNSEERAALAARADDLWKAHERAPRTADERRDLASDAALTDPHIGAAFETLRSLLLAHLRRGDFEGLSQAFFDTATQLATEPDGAGRISLAALSAAARHAVRELGEPAARDASRLRIAVAELEAQLLLGVGLAYNDARETAFEQLIAERTAALTKEKALADTIIETLPGLFFVIDHQQRLVRWNREVEKATGYDASEIVTHHPLDFFDQADLPFLEQKMLEAFVAGGASAEAILVSRDGTRHPRWFTSRRVELEEGPLLVGIGIDISERREAELRVQREKRFADSIVESLPGVFYLFDDRGQFLRWNRNFETVTQYSGEEIGRMHPVEFFAGDDQQVIAERIGEVLRTGQSTAEAHFVSRDGTRRPFFFTGLRVSVDDQTCVIGMGIDVTERKQAEDAVAERTRELARSNADLEQFAYVASHDLQEPLRAVKSYTQLLARRYPDRIDRDARRYIERSVAAVSRMQSLIDDLLAYSRVGRGDEPFVPTDSEAVMREVLDDLQASVSETCAEVHHSPLPTLPADRSQLHQLMQNLIANAIKFRGNAPPQVHVSATRHGSFWRFTVQDNGIGIEPEYAERVFIIFQRLHSRRHYPGTGVGLAVCKKIVEHHGGRIWIEPSATPGTCVCFELPA